MVLVNKNILLGVTGSIAAYKSPDLVRRLRDAGAHVRVVMTANAQRFITALTMQAVSGFPVHHDLFDEAAEAAMGHIELARWADLILIAPASADCVRRLAQGSAEDLLSTLCLATKAPIALVPAMNQVMWENDFTQHNIHLLRAKDIKIFDPAAGSQACGEIGPGRMLEPTDIVKKVTELFSSGLLTGTKVVVTAGPTHEAIDPVRFITNGSSGKMGYALATAAQEANAHVTLISGPVQLAPPKGVDIISVTSAQEMVDATLQQIKNCDIFLSVAAVGDYRCQTIAQQKIHKHEENLQLMLEKNPDIVAQVGQLTPKPFIVGFAAETENVIAQAKLKKQRKNMDMIIANEVGKNKGLGADNNAVTVIVDQDEIHFPLTSKTDLARQLIQLIAAKFKGKKYDR